MSGWSRLDGWLAALFGGDLLAIYLQDHVAGATFGVELARRAGASNAGTELGEFLAWLTIQIEEDRAVLAALVKRLGGPADRLKSALAWAGEKAGRLKRNGRFVTYSPLSRVLELEGLIAGVNGKHALWSVLRDRAEHEGRLDRAECERLIGRAEHQLAELRRRHRGAAALAFSA